MPELSPVYNHKIAHRFSSKTLDRKLLNKLELQKELGWPEEPKRPMVCLPAGMSDALGGTLMEEALPGILRLPIEIIILGKGSSSYGELFTKLAKEHRHRIAILPAKEEETHQMYAAADMALFFADPARLPELENCLNYGVVPVAPETRALEDYDPIQEQGSAFLYEDTNPWDFHTALVRALETYKLPFDWRTIQRQCMESAK